MSIFYTADTHFGHTNIITLCNRPFDSVHHMNKTIINRWNKVVKPNDLVIHVGDFSSSRCSNPEPYLKHLNGNIILVRGNHDKNRLVNKMPLWTQQMQVKIGDFKCLISHRPYYVYEQHDKYKKFYEEYNKDIEHPEKYDFIISGHIHEKRLWTGKSINVGVDVHYFRPIYEDDLLDMFTRKKNL